MMKENNNLPHLPPVTMVLILTPTHELAQQTYEVISMLATAFN
jgi:superfamily II DNA/RNA helicase